MNRLTLLTTVSKLIILVLSSTVSVAQPLHAASLEGLDALNCVIHPSMEANVGSHSAGVLKELSVDLSEYVTQGDIIAKLDSGAEKSAVDLAQARANNAAELAFRQLSADHSKRQFTRTNQLDRRNTISEQELDDLKTEAELSQLKLREVIESKAILVLEVARAEELLNRRSIRSPFDGVVIKRFKTVGEFIDTDPLMRIAQLNPLHVETIMPAKYLGDVKAGMFASIVSATVPGAQWKARIDQVDSVIDIASGTFGVRLVLPNPGLDIPAGLRCQLSFIEAVVPIATTATGASFAFMQSYSDVQLYQHTAVTSATTGQRKSDTVPYLAAAIPLETPQTGSQENHCISHGPYESHHEAQQKQSALQLRSIKVSIQAKSNTHSVGELVVSPPMKTREAADMYKKTVIEAGFSDSFIMGSSSPYHVAVGAFRRQSAADTMIEQLKAQEIESIVRPWEQRHEQYYLVGRDHNARGTSFCQSTASDF